MPARAPGSRRSRPPPRGAPRWVGDNRAVAEIDRDTHAAELKTMDRLFADVKTTDEVVAMLNAAILIS